MTSIRLVAFDLDGTLVDSAPDIARAVDLMNEELGIEPPGLEKVREWVGDGARRLIKRALTGTRDAEPSAELYQRGFEAFRRHYRAHVLVETRFYPGARETLHTLCATGFKLACVTNKSAEFTEPLLQGLGLNGLFDVVVSGDSLPQRKPDPAPLLHAARYCEVAPQHSCMVGDSRNDILAARAAGFQAVAVCYGYHQGQDLARLNPDKLLDSLAELPEWLMGQTPGLAERAASR